MRSVAFGLLLLGACGGGNGGGLGARAITAAEAEPLCRADCQRDVDCGFATDLELCTDNCVADVVGWARGDAVEAILECSAGLACDATGDDQCIVGLRPLAIHEDWETKCRPALMGCLGDPQAEAEVCESTPDGSDAGFISLIAPELMPAIIACLDGADCTARLDCLMAEFAAHNIDF